MHVWITSYRCTLLRWQVLHLGGAAVDAVEAAVRVMEDDPIFDAGRGSVLTEDGQVTHPNHAQHTDSSRLILSCACTCVCVVW